MAYLPPGRLLMAANRVLVALGVTDAVRVRGRRTGTVRALAVNVLRLDGRRYLVAPRGDTQWVRNVRAAGGCEVRTAGRWEALRARELPVADRPPLIAAYLRRWGWQVGAQFRALPDAADHPVFELERPAEQAAGE